MDRKRNLFTPVDSLKSAMWPLTLGGLLFLSAQSQPVTEPEPSWNRYVVFFRDKAQHPLSLSEPQQFLSNRALLRRQRENISLTEQDLPVHPNYREQVEAVRETEVLFASRWKNALLVQAKAEALEQIQNLPFVRDVEWVAKGKHPARNEKPPPQPVQHYWHVSTESLPLNYLQNAALGIDVMHKEGFKGQNVWIAVLDAGYKGVDKQKAFAHLFQKKRVLMTYDFVTRHEDVYYNESLSGQEHGTSVLSCIAAYVPQIYEGGAPEAHFALFITEDTRSEQKVEEYYWLLAAERADSLGVDIITASLGYRTFDNKETSYKYDDTDGETAVSTLAAQWASERGMLVISSAGNSGSEPYPYDKISPPADAPHILAVGGTDPGGHRVPFSSKGPTFDKRLKPDVVAQAHEVLVFNGKGQFVNLSGTSFAAPMITGLLAGLKSYYPDKPAKELRHLLLKSTTHHNKPDTLKGYGMPHFLSATGRVPAQKLRTSLVAFPNPVYENKFSHGILYVEHPYENRPQAPRKAELELVSFSGQRMRTAEQFRNTGRVFVVSLNGLPKGIYLLRQYDTDQRRYLLQVLKIIYK